MVVMDDSSTGLPVTIPLTAIGGAGQRTKFTLDGPHGCVTAEFSHDLFS